MFSFESNNGQLLKLFNGTRHVLRQITSKYILKHLHHVKEPSNLTANSTNKITDFRKIELKKMYTDVLYEMNIPFLHDDFPVFTAINIGTQKYTSVAYKRAKKSCNYFGDSMIIFTVKYSFSLKLKI